MLWMPLNIILATQKKMMSKPVTSTLVGYHLRSSAVSAGQPMVEKGHRAELNQVSSTSGSWARSVPPQALHWVGSSRRTMSSPQP